MKSLLTSSQQANFDNKIYTEKFFDIADYSVITSKYENMDIVVSSWLTPHEDQECEHEDIWVFKVLELSKEKEENQVSFVYTDTKGNIVGTKLEIGKQYAFNYKKTHAILPYHLAIKVFESQSFKIKEVKNFFSKKQFQWNAKIAYCFLNIEPANFHF